MISATLSLAGWVLPGTLAILSLALAGAATYFAHRAMARRGESEEAFSVLAKHMNLSRADRRMVRELAEQTRDATPAGLLISEHAFRKAADAQRAAGDQPAQRVAETRDFAARAFRNAA